MACTSGKRGQCPILEFWTRSMELRGNTTDAASPTILLFIIHALQTALLSDVQLPSIQ